MRFLLDPEPVTAAPTLELRHLSKTYSPKSAPVQDLSLTVTGGEFLTLLGPSGCGKSTVLRLIAGLESPTQGQVLINGRDVTALPAGDRNVAMVFQSYALYPHMSVYQNIASSLKLRKIPPAEIQQRVQEVADFLGLADLMQRKPAQLSGGQRQRVAVARSLVRRPEVFLLDEPLSNLDALLRERVRAELKQLFSRQPVPVVYVTHDQTEAMTLSTQVAVLHQGRLQQLDKPQRIYTHPANQFVAGFVGSPQMNFLPVVCDQGCAWMGEHRIPLPTTLSPVPDRLILGIRPEHIQLATAESASIAATIFLVEDLGMHRLISLEILGGRQTVPLQLRCLLSSDRPLSDDTLRLTLPAEHLHWFDGNTGVALAGICRFS